MVQRKGDAMKHTVIHLALVSLVTSSVVSSAWRHSTLILVLSVVGLLIVAELGAQTRGIVGETKEVEKRIEKLRSRL